LLQQLELFGEPPERLHFCFRFHSLDFHGTLGLFDPLVGKRLRHADVRRNFVVGGVDGGEGTFDLVGRVDPSDQ
jgi:hypothetical protein